PIEFSQLYKSYIFLCCEFWSNSNNPIDLHCEKPINCASAPWENTLLFTSPDSTKDWRSENAS
ncbi:hypothetical protein Nmel_012007, partial [Mimus melanotis]